MSILASNIFLICGTASAPPSEVERQLFSHIVVVGEIHKDQEGDSDNRTQTLTHPNGVEVGHKPTYYINSTNSGLEKCFYLVPASSPNQLSKSLVTRALTLLSVCKTISIFN